MVRKANCIKERILSKISVCIKVISIEMAFFVQKSVII